MCVLGVMSVCTLEKMCVCCVVGEMHMGTCQGILGVTVRDIGVCVLSNVCVHTRQDECVCECVC